MTKLDSKMNYVFKSSSNGIDFLLKWPLTISVKDKYSINECILVLSD